MRRRPTQLICALIAIVAPVCVFASGAEQPFSVTLQALSKTLKPGCQVYLLVTIKNTSSRDLTFVRGSAFGVSHEGTEKYRIEAHDEQGRPAPPSALVLESRKPVASGKAVVEWSYENQARTLKPGESFVDAIDVTEYYDLSRPGIYTIWVSRHMPPKVTSHGVEWPKGSVRSNAITVTVTK
jgi:hypothetical protein